MEGVLNVGVGTLTRQSLVGVSVGIAVGSAAVALCVTWLLHPNLGAVLFMQCPFLLALAIWLIAGVTRLRLVGFLPSNADHLIPTRLQPWIRLWLLVRFGLLVGWTIPIVAIIATAILGGPVRYCVEALVYLVWLRIFLDLCFGSAFNIGIVVGRQSAA